MERKSNRMECRQNERERQSWGQRWTEGKINTYLILLIPHNLVECATRTRQGYIERHRWRDREKEGEHVCENEK